MLAYRLRRWPIITPTLGERFLFAHLHLALIKPSQPKLDPQQVVSSNSQSITRDEP